MTSIVLTLEIVYVNRHLNKSQNLTDKNEPNEGNLIAWKTPRTELLNLNQNKIKYRGPAH